ncbi:MAG TPA: hypothetical protein VMF30_07870, partial [Pirellulales bacterium]|nr:hypothetical protein [Pirellulales bacterium]
MRAATNEPPLKSVPVEKPLRSDRAAASNEPPPNPAPPKATANEPPGAAASSTADRAAISFQRDPQQLTFQAFELWWLTFSGDERFLAAGGG